MAEPGDAVDSVRRDVVGGVPVFWTEKANRFIGSLQFRVGRCDESLPTSGLTHLVEHLALYPMGHRLYHANGMVDHIRTVFHTQGSETDVVGHLGEVVTSLASLPLDRLPSEARVLRTESASWSPTLPSLMLWYRYGAQHHGLTALPEFGLHALGPKDASDWSATRFTRGNSAAWFSGPLPESLRLELPEGPRVPPPERPELPDLPRRAWIPSQLPGIGLGVIVTRDSANAMGLRVLLHRLEQRLRYEQGRSYEVSLAYVPLDGKEAQATFFASCLETESGTVRDHFLAVVEKFAIEGPTAEELAHDLEEYDRAMADPDRVIGELERCAHSELVGMPPDTPGQIRADMVAVTTDSARTSFEEAMAGSLLMDSVGKAPIGGSWVSYPVWSRITVAGRRLAPSSKRFPWSKVAEQLVVGPDGVSWLGTEGQVLTVLYRECVGMLVDGSLRILHGRDGFTVRVGAEYWADGARAVKEIDAAIPEDLVVRIQPSSDPSGPG